MIKDILPNRYLLLKTLNLTLKMISWVYTLNVKTQLGRRRWATEGMRVWEKCLLLLCVWKKDGCNCNWIVYLKKLPNKQLKNTFRSSLYLCFACTLHTMCYLNFQVFFFSSSFYMNFYHTVQKSHRYFWVCSFSMN